MGIKKELPDNSKLRQHAEKALDLEEDTEAFLKMSPENMATLVHELQVHQIELEMQNTELRRLCYEIETARDAYSHLYDFAPVGYVTVSEKGLINKANLTFATMLGQYRGDLIGKPFTIFILKDDQDVFYLHRQRLLKTETIQTCELRLLNKDGHGFYARLESMLMPNNAAESRQIRVVASDISEYKNPYEQLENTNKALDVLLKKREQDKKEIEKNIFSNYELMIEPFLNKLKNSVSTKHQQHLVEIVEINLKEIIKPFTRKLSSPLTRLTQSEIHIATLIKQGFTNKEIAQTLNCSKRTIDTHRENIRKKLELTNKKTNLKTFLLNL